MYYLLLLTISYMGKVYIMHNNSLYFQSPKLSGIGRQLDQLDNSNDPDRACKVSCQDSTLPQRFVFIKKNIYIFQYQSKYLAFYFQFYQVLRRL